MRPHHSAYAPSSGPGAGASLSSGFFFGGTALGAAGGSLSGSLPLAMSYPSGAVSSSSNARGGSQPHANARRSSWSTACAVLGFERVTGVYLFSCLACISVAIAFNTAGSVAYEYYVSCHGSATVSHGVFLVLVAFQVFFIVLKWWRPTSSAAWAWLGDAPAAPSHAQAAPAVPLAARASPAGGDLRLEDLIQKGSDPTAVAAAGALGASEKAGGLLFRDDPRNPGAALWHHGGLRLKAALREGEESLSARSRQSGLGAGSSDREGDGELFAAVGTVGFWRTLPALNESLTREGPSAPPLLMEEEHSDPDIDDGRPAFSARFRDLESGRQGFLYTGGRALLVPSWRPRGICWNSTWVTLEYLVYGLGFYSAVLGWRVYGGLATSNFATLRTCAHMNVLSFGADLPLVHSVVSDFSFVESYLALATTMLIVRKYRDPYWLSSYCSWDLFRKCPKSLKTVFILQAFLQVAILATAAAKIARCWMTGYGTPMQILSALMLVSVLMWAVTVLGHVLQTDRMPTTFAPTLEYHWLWAMICMAIIWFCGFLFYLSVYGVRCWPFLAVHTAVWLVYVLVTAWKFHAIFPNWMSGLEDTEAFSPPSDDQRHVLARGRREQSVRVFRDEPRLGSALGMPASYR
ncbi:hypothetical protein BESB_001650 [Besnoitia besnoiti]|uniref:Transmembrane protein n=1 Tax=Besnoitia besnoiti TaxID=94643 RepID=A0A2A9MP75_BESBE|nr:hypothetical protein BESB_001650 [Besnoitia besnoiti]PFH37823.1 hypothetical protein BESB_001650 [Besnoitia besnoiti]